MAGNVAREPPIVNRLEAAASAELELPTLFIVSSFAWRRRNGSTRDVGVLVCDSRSGKKWWRRSWLWSWSWSLAARKWLVVGTWLHVLSLLFLLSSVLILIIAQVGTVRALDGVYGSLQSLVTRKVLLSALSGRGLCEPGHLLVGTLKSILDLGLGGILTDIEETVVLVHVDDCGEGGRRNVWTVEEEKRERELWTC